jgi:hypothetical protein
MHCWYSQFYLNHNFQAVALALEFPERVTFQLIPFREWRGRLPDNSPECFRLKAGEVISAHGSEQQIQHLITFMHPYTKST